MKITIFYKIKEDDYIHEINFSPYNFDIDFKTKTIFLKSSELFDGKMVYRGEITRFTEIINIKGDYKNLRIGSYDKENATIK